MKNQQLPYLFIGCLLLLLNAFNSNAKQLSFKKVKQATQTQFSYRFKDHDRVSHKLSFTLENATLFGHFRHFRGYKPERMQETVLMTLKKMAAQVDRRTADIRFVERNNSFEIVITGEDQQINDNTLKRLIEMQTQIQSEYLKKAYYNILVEQHGPGGIKPDHVRFAQESYQDVAPIVEAITQTNPNLRGRKLIEYILAFVQAIPYSTLESRFESNGAGFNPPLRLINNNQGDCDSKVTLMATLVNAIYPRIKIVIVYLSNHALIGIQMTHSKNDKWIKLKDREYILAEPTGPAMIPFGQVAKSSDVYIDSEQFNYEIF